jgi:hypothetical protein
LIWHEKCIVFFLAFLFHTLAEALYYIHGHQHSEQQNAFFFFEHTLAEELFQSGLPWKERHKHSGEKEKGAGITKIIES